MKQIYRLEIVAQEEDYDRVCGLLALEVSFGWEEENLPSGETRFRIHCEQEDYLQALQERVRHAVPEARQTLSAIEEKDWVDAWKQFFTPVCCGSRFVVLPPWLADKPEFADRTPIVIEPKSAFGTGHHATTALCLRVISDLLDEGRIAAGQRFLDLGTGSGVLGIGCCKYGLQGAGLDIDSLAVDNALENHVDNELATYAGSDNKAYKRFDILMGAGLGVELFGILNVTAGYDWGLFNQSKLDGVKLHRNQFNVGLGISF